MYFSITFIFATPFSFILCLEERNNSQKCVLQVDKLTSDQSPVWGLLSSNCLELFGHGNSITKHQVMNRTLQDKVFINGISLSKSWSWRILPRIIIKKKIIVMLEKGCAYCSHIKSVQPGIFVSQFAWIMFLRVFVFHGINCSSDFLFWKNFLLDFTWV